MAETVKERELESVDSLADALRHMDKCVILDIETTGFSRTYHAEIIQIGALLLDIPGKKFLKKFETNICPSEIFNIPKKITEVTGLTWQDVKDSPYIEEILPSFAEFLGDYPVVAHNAQFDWNRFLVPAFESVGLHMNNRCICSMQLAKYLYPGRGRSGYNLESLCEMWGHTVEGHHNATTDAKYTASIFLKMLDEYRYHTTHTFAPGDQIKPVVHPAQADLNDLRIQYVSPYPGASKKAGPSIYVNTNFGKLCFSVRRRKWTCKQLRTDNNVPIEAWSQAVLRKLGKDEFTFIATYTPDYFLQQVEKEIAV